MNQILIGKGESQVWLDPAYGNRHGLIAGATGTGKTVTLLVLAEGFSRLGVPVFMADVKGDVAGLAMPGTMSDKLAERINRLGIDSYTQEGSPVIFWDLFGKSGHPVRTTISWRLGTTKSLRSCAPSATTRSDGAAGISGPSRLGAPAPALNVWVPPLSHHRWP